MVWEQVILQLVISLAQVLPAAIEAIKGSGTLTDEQKKAALDVLQGQLEQVKAQVAAVKYLSLASAEGEETPTSPGTPIPENK